MRSGRHEEGGREACRGKDGECPQMAMRGSKRWVRGVMAGLCLLALLVVGTFPAHAQVEYPLNSTGVMSVTLNGEFVVSEDDLRVKVPGGHVRINRDFDGVQWTVNRQWSGLHSPGAARAFYASVGTYMSCTIYSGINSCDSGSGGMVTVPGGLADLLKNRGSMRILNDEDFSGGDTPEQLPEFVTRKGAGFSISSDRGSYHSNDYPRFVIRPQPVLSLPPSTGPDAHPAQGDPRLAATSGRGFRWTDRSGQWIEYDNQGRITSYGDRNDVRVWFQYGSHGQAERVIDDNGRTVFTLLYTDGNAEFVSEVRDHTPLDGGIRRVRYEYDDGQLVRVHDARGHVTRFEYSGAKLSKVVDAAGRTTTIHYNAPPIPRSSYRVAGSGMAAGRSSGVTSRSVVSGDGLRGEQQRRLAKIVAPDGGETEIEYSYDRLKKEFSMTVKHPETASGRRVEHVKVDADGRLVSHEVNGNVLLSSTGSRKSATYTDERGAQTTIRRDAFDEITSVKHADGSSISYSFEAGSLDMREVVDEAGVVDRYEYDDRGNVIRSTWAAGKPEQQVREYRYDSRGQLEQVTRKGVLLPGGATTRDIVEAFEYDSHGNLVVYVDGDGHRWRAGYDAQGNRIRLVDPLGKVWTARYDAHANVIEDVDPTGVAWTYAYDPTGQETAQTDGAGNTWAISLDAAGRISGMVNPLGATFTQEYDQAGRLRRSRDASGNASVIDYDAAGRIAGVTDAGGARTAVAYTDVDGMDRGTRLASRIQYPTFERRLRYDSRRRPSQQADIAAEDARVTGTVHDVLNRLQSQTDANGHTRRYAYDALGRLSMATDPLGNSVSLAYDQLDNVVVFTDENGRITRLVYDGRGNLVGETNPLGQTRRSVFDAAGNLVERILPDGARITYAYDDAGRPVGRRTYRADGSAELAEAFAWDAAENLTSWTTDGASGVLEYDTADRLTSEAVSIGEATLARRYTYHPGDEVASFTGPDGSTLHYSWDGYGNLERVDIPGEGSISVTARQWMAPATIVFPGGVVQEQERDGLLNLTRLRVRTPQQTTVFDLRNSFGQLSELTAREVDGRETTFDYDAALRLVEADAGFAGGNSETFVIDAAGNRTQHSAVSGTWAYDDANRLLSRGSVTYAYDDSGNLVERVDSSLSEPARTTRYSYDVLGRLAEIRDGAGALVARYTYDPFDNRLSKTVAGETTLYLHGEEGLLAEADATGQVLRTYGWDPQGSYGTAPLFQRDGTAYYYYHNDHLGTPWRVTNRAGAVVWAAARYSAYGTATVAGGSQIEQPWRFAGQYLDAESGLHYNLRRYYDAEAGRYISEDPLRFDSASNFYAYAYNSPGNFIDPTGEFVFLLPLAANYARCVAMCMAVDMAADLLSGECLSLASLGPCAAGCILGGLPLVKAPCKMRKLAAAIGAGVGIGAAAAGNSFAGDTLVLTPEGHRRIDELRPGDEVIAYAEWEGQARTEKVTDVILSNREQVIVTLELANGNRIEVTGGHPIYTPSGWRAAQLLQAGGQVYVAGEDGVLVPMQIAGADTRSQVVLVYNLEVAHSHTFFVGEDGVVAHNGKSPPPPPGFKPTGGRSHGQPIYKKGNRYISFDADSHNGGVWKMCKGSPNNLRNRNQRMGTYNADLTERVGP